MTKTRYTVLFAVVGAAIALWSKRGTSGSRPVADAGEVIFSNTPRPFGE